MSGKDSTTAVVCREQSLLERFRGFSTDGAINFEEGPFFVPEYWRQRSRGNGGRGPGSPGLPANPSTASGAGEVATGASPKVGSRRGRRPLGWSAPCLSGCSRKFRWRSGEISPRRLFSDGEMTASPSNQHQESRSKEAGSFTSRGRGTCGFVARVTRGKVYGRSTPTSPDGSGSRWGQGPPSGRCR